MSKRKTVQEIKSNVTSLIKEAKAGRIKGKTVQFNCGDSLIVAVNKGTGLAKWYARVGVKTVLLGEYGKMEYKTASAQLEKLKKEHTTYKKRSSCCPTLIDYFETYMSHWIVTHKKGSGRQDNLKSLMKNTLYPLHKYKLNELTRKIIIDRIRYIQQTPNNKHNGVALLNQILRHACNNAIIESNPISDLLNNNDSPFPREQPKHHVAVHPDAFIEKVVQPLAETAEFYRAAYLMCFLTGFRFGEFRLMRWSWIDTKHMSINIPVEAEGANKTKHVLIKPLTTPVKELLQYLKAVNALGSDFVFQSPANPSPAPIGDNTIREPWRQLVGSEVSHFHGVRTTIRTWIKEQCITDPETGYTKPVFSFEAAEGALTHDTRDTLEKTYDISRRIEPVRTVLKAWNEWLVKKLPKPFLIILEKGREHPIDWKQTI